jgi:hypothetical protein
MMSKLDEVLFKKFSSAGLKPIDEAKQQIKELILHKLTVETVFTAETEALIRKKVDEL